MNLDIENTVTLRKQIMIARRLITYRKKCEIFTLKKEKKNKTKVPTNQSIFVTQFIKVYDCARFVTWSADKKVFF